MPDASAVARLRAARGFVLDMDGTLVLGDPGGGELVPIPGAAELLTTLRDRGIPFVVFTNGTGRSSSRYAASLRRAGLPVSAQQVLTPADSLAAVCRRRGHRRVVVLAGRSSREPLAAAGVEALPPGADGQVDAVFTGWFPQCRFAHFQAACDAVWAGARLYSASQSATFATAHGRTVATSRAISAAIRDLTGQRIEVVGKPSAAALGMAARRLGCSRADVAVVGDDPELDVAMALRHGALAVAVRSSVATVTDLEALAPASRPHLTLPSIADMLELL